MRTWDVSLKCTAAFPKLNVEKVFVVIWNNDDVEVAWAKWHETTMSEVAEKN